MSGPSTLTAAACGGQCTLDSGASNGLACETMDMVRGWQCSASQACQVPANHSVQWGQWQCIFCQERRSHLCRQMGKPGDKNGILLPSFVPCWKRRQEEGRLEIPTLKTREDESKSSSVCTGWAIRKGAQQAYSAAWCLRNYPRLRSPIPTTQYWTWKNFSCD